MPHNLFSFYNFTSYYFNIYSLIEFKFYSKIKLSIKILIHYIFFNRNNTFYKYIEPFALEKAPVGFYCSIYINTIIIKI